MKRVILATFVLIAVCTSDVDLSGVYMVTSDVDSTPCGIDAPVTSPPLYVKWSKDSFIGSEFWGFATCTDASGATCTGGPSLFTLPLGEPTDTGWRGEEYTASNGG